MKSAGISKNQPMITVVVLLVSIFVWGLSSATAGVETPPLPPNPPSGLAFAPPCLDPELLPDQAKVPCVGIGQFREGTSAADRADIVRGAGAILKFNYELVNAAAVFVPDEAALSALLEDPNIVALIPDRPVYALGKPDATGGVMGNKANSGATVGQVVPAGVRRIGATPGILNVTGNSVGVAIVDTGIDFAHPDLAVGNFCFDAFGGNCQDGNGHGTHVGGIVAARNNGIDVVGVAPDATPYAVRVLNNAGSGSDSTVMAGLDWVGMMNAKTVNPPIPPIRVVNMSLGRPGTLDDNPLLRASVQALTSAGISVVVATGNDPGKEVSQMVPATYPEVMAVASTTADKGANACKFFAGFIARDTASYFTTDGALTAGIGVTISAPGEQQENINRSCFIQPQGILSLKAGGGTTRMSGTSMAAPHVAGVISLMVQAAGGTLDPEVARNIIRATASGIVPTPTTPYDSPTKSYTFDREREGVLSACGALGSTCP